jgi:GT2 family glycosyltransferase
VSWNVRDYLLRCLTALQTDDVRGGLSVQIIVVDNGSRDGTVEALSHFPLTLIVNKENIGYGRANNVGLSRADGKYLLILNPDTIPQPGSLTRLVRFAATCGPAGIVSPQLRNEDGSLQTGAYRFPTLAMAALDLFPLPRFIPGRARCWLEQSSINGRYQQERSAPAPFRIDHPLGACLLIKRAAYQACGGFDEKIFMYSEEIELALRYAREGWQCWQEPRAVVVHLGGRSTRQMAERMFVELWRSRLYIYSKFYTPLSAWLLRLLLGSAMLARLALGKLRSVKNEKDLSEMRRAHFVLRMLRDK